MIIQLVDRSVKHLISILKDVLVQVSKFLILWNFMVMTMDDDSQAPIILGMSFTARVVINEPARKLSFEMCAKKIDFCFILPTAFPTTAPSILEVPMALIASIAIFKTRVFEGDREPDIRCYALYDLPISILTYFGDLAIHLGRGWMHHRSLLQLCHLPSSRHHLFFKKIAKLGT